VGDVPQVGCSLASKHLCDAGEVIFLQLPPSVSCELVGFWSLKFTFC
jgi:hypothetical protein